MRRGCAKIAFRCSLALAIALVGGRSTFADEAAAPGAATPAVEPVVDFAHDVLPIFARRCFACHGPDKAEGGLRLNSLESAVAKLESGDHAIVPGSPAASEVLKRIASDDDDERMPPREKPLTAEQIAIVRRWIASGAEWKNHWAFEPLRPQTPPAVRDSAWVKNPIDAFILAPLEAHQLAPAAPADKRTLLRRAYYDLTGLPPSPAEVDAFVADSSPDALRG